MQEDHKLESHLFLGLVIYTLGACFYLYEFILQVAPGVMTNDLMRDLGIDAATLGIISSAYFYAYMPMQLPAGVLYDRFGPRILLALMITVCSMGALFFSQTNTVFFAALGRAMMGAGSAFAFIGALILVSRWLPSSLFAVSTGIVQALGCVGAIVGGLPLAYVVDTYGWRSSIFGIACIGFVLAILLWLIVRDSPPGIAQHSVKHKGELIRLKYICGNLQTWVIAIYAFLMWAPVIVFAELWGTPFLSSYYAVSTEKASSIIAMMWLGIAVGAPVLGMISQRIGLRRMPLIWMAVLGFVTSILSIYCKLPITMLHIMLFTLGSTAAGAILSFSLVKENNKLSNVGTAIGFNNMMVVAGGAVLQPFVGYVLRITWDGQLQNNIPTYTAYNYQLGMIIIPLCYLISGIISWYWIKENYCKQFR